MSAAKHTPGPWRICTSGNFGNVVEGHTGKEADDFDSGYRTVAMFQACTSADTWLARDENAAANGRLIAAAPDLAADGQFLLDRLSDFESEISDEQAREWFGHVQPAIARFRAAIAKAEGRT